MEQFGGGKALRYDRSCIVYLLKDFNSAHPMHTRDGKHGH